MIRNTPTANFSVFSAMNYFCACVRCWGEYGQFRSSSTVSLQRGRGSVEKKCAEMILFFRLAPKFFSRNVLHNVGHFLLSEWAANFIFLSGGTGTRVLDVKMY